MAQQVLLASDRTAQARHALSVAAAHLDEALAVATAALAGARAASAEHGLALLRHTRETIAEELHRIEQAERIVLGFHAALVVGDSAITEPPGGAREAVAQESSSRTPANTRRSQPGGDDASPLGRWRDRTATEHVLDEGNAIGRAPARRKKDLIREVRSVEELDELFTALAAGGRDAPMPSYIGRLLRRPDGTTIGYRTKSKTTVEPTVDMKIPGGRSLKIQVNTQKWST
ncbi:MULTISPECIES: hypothetical protein [Actinoalloteichus]|uniref:hypothetical protein n=1 Tax=Actinoalloteichus TaxID=65496 RepID=UPI0012F8DFCE|nr:MULTISPECIES: hypothetical protein [Actinoalloteichus]